MGKVIRLEEMTRLASPDIVSEFLERELEIKNIFMVVGRPGSGKSTFLKMIEDLDDNSFCIDTDAYSKSLRPLLEKKFEKADLIDIALNQPRQMIRIISGPWLEMAAASLSQAKSLSNVFVEVPYGLRPEFRMYRYFGAKIIYVGCENETVNEARIKNRGDPRTARFIAAIPDKKLTLEIAATRGLRVTCIDTSKSTDELRLAAAEFLARLR
jgi:energy-coupling factor transporter ATP-binding protein EcfA2